MMWAQMGTPSPCALLPDRVELRFVQQFAAEVGQGLRADHAQPFDAAPQFEPGGLRVLHRQHGDPLQAVGIGAAVFGQPVVVRRGDRGAEARVLYRRRGAQADERAEQDRDVDAFQVHVGDPLVRVLHARAIPAPLVGGLAGFGPQAELAVEIAPARPQLALDDHVTPPIRVADPARGVFPVALRKPRRPIDRFFVNVPVGVDDRVGRSHDLPPWVGE